MGAACSHPDGVRNVKPEQQLAGAEKEHALISQAADRIDALSSRAASRIHSAFTELLHDMGSIAVALASYSARFKAECARLSSHRSLWLDKQHEECDAIEKAFMSLVRLIDSDALAPEDTLGALILASPLLDAGSFPRLSAVIAVDVNAFLRSIPVISGAVRVQDGPSAAHCELNGPGLSHCVPGATDHARALNRFTFTCADVAGEGIRGLDASDFTVSVAGGPGAGLDTVVVDVTMLPNGSLDIVYIITTLGSAEVSSNRGVNVSVSLFGDQLAHISIRLGRTIFGTHSRTIRIATDYSRPEKRWGIALSGNTLFTSSLVSKSLFVITVSPFAVVRTFGGMGSEPGQFQRPTKLCLAPNGNLLIPDDYNCRLVEMAQDGAFVRTFGSGPVDGYIISVALSRDGLVATGKGKDQDGPQVFVFEYATGNLIRSFGKKGTGPGELHSCAGMRFTPDARHLIIAERRNNRLSVFTPLGEFLCHIGAGVIDNPHDIDFADNGDLIVPELDDGRVCILSPMSLTEPPVLLRRFSGFQYPTAVLMHAGELYVLEEEARELRVFT